VVIEPFGQLGQRCVVALNGRGRAVRQRIVEVLRPVVGGPLARDEQPAGLNLSAVVGDARQRGIASAVQHGNRQTLRQNVEALHFIVPDAS